MEHNVKYDDGVETGAVLRIEGVCLPKVEGHHVQKQP